MRDIGPINLVSRFQIDRRAKAFGLESWNLLVARIKTTDGALAGPMAALTDGPVRLAQVELGCTDLVEAERFYCEVLGLPLSGRITDSIFVRCGDLNLIIQQSENPRLARTTYFNGDGRVHEVAAAWRARGVVFTEEPRRIARNHEGVDVWLGFFDDPWGNQLALLANMPIE